ncbi:SIR2 family protein [Kribbella sp. NBC_00382]|uniref:SIR2 family NAD-dependent protein deacylase n=1 Tax=Kribbella sp. NBC_00382 TaxID=2975967 RepID=UPI002E1AAB02
MARSLTEADWERLMDQLQDGDCTPFLGAGAGAGHLPTGAALATDSADEHGYPFKDKDDLTRVFQYVVSRGGDAVYEKGRLARKHFHGIEQPDFTQAHEPHALLARFPIPVYLTTNYDGFMAAALSNQGKQPHQAICPWYAGATQDPVFDTPAGYAPAADKPIVYHLHGNSSEPRSLVISEDDYLDFLVRVAGKQQILPPVIEEALGSRPLLFIGYSLQDWTFRVVFRGLLATVPPHQQRRHMSVQLLPDRRDDTEETRAAAQEYLAEYFDNMRISIYWGTAQEFCTELTARLDGRT